MLELVLFSYSIFGGYLLDVMSRDWAQHCHNFVMCVCVRVCVHVWFICKCMVSGGYSESVFLAANEEGASQLALA